jgi:23S rRNA (guanine745-N1)-methyltransferase
LATAGKSAGCSRGHAFDYARSGYLNLTRASANRPRAADTAAMVQARAEFLAAGHYRRLADAVAAAARAANPAPRLMIEVGSGTGYYLDAVARELREHGGAPGCAVGIDLSKPAANHAARHHDDLVFVVADIEEGIPVCDAGVDLALSVFAPRPAPELGRVVRPGGELIVAFAGPRHLEGLRQRLGLIGVQEDKLDLLAKRLDPWFDAADLDLVEYELELDGGDAERLALMGPNAWHGFDRDALGEGLTDIVSVGVARFGRRHP